MRQPSQQSAKRTGSLFRRLPPMHIGTFIGILHLMIGILGAGIISAFSLYFIYQNGVQSNLRELEDLAFITVNALESQLSAYKAGDVTVSEIDETLTRYLQSRPEVRFTILSPQGEALLPDSSACQLSDTSLNAPEVQAALNSTIGHSVRVCPRGEWMFYVAVKIQHNQEEYGVLILAAPYNDLMSSTFTTMRWMGVIALLIVAFTVIEGWLGSVYISRPLARLSSVAEQLSQGDLDARAEQNGPLEVVHLAGTLNEMASRLQNNLDSMRAFVANASHELRTPLTTIKLQVGALVNGACEEPEVGRRFLGQIEAEIDRLTRLVNDMLDLSQIESANTARLLEPVNLVDLASEVLAFWEARSHQAGLELQLSADAELPNISGDPFRLRQLFDNLLDNAIKHTPEGGQVVIRLRRPSRESGGHAQDMVRIEVHDTGIGIAAEHLPYIFDRFYRIEMARLDQKPAAKPNGSGLGLAIARSIVIAHGGEIGVISQPGAGSTFWVMLPVANGMVAASKLSIDIKLP